MWIEIFKTGTHQDAEGRTKTWSEADLDQIIRSYNPAEHQAPLVLGHPEHDQPAYGWVAELKREGQVLLARLVKVSKKLKDWVNQGHYQKRSISLYGDLRLRHVGLLGAQPPAIKGLKDFSFAAAAPATLIEEEISKPESLEILHARLEAQAAEIERLRQALANAQAEPEEEPSQVPPLETPEEMPLEEDSAADTEAEFEEESELGLIEQMKALAQRLQTLEAQLAEPAAPSKESEGLTQNLDLALAQGRILPAWQEPLRKILESLSLAPQNFSEGQTQPSQALWNFVDGLKVQGLYQRLNFGQMPKPQTEEERALQLGREIAKTTGMANFSKS